MVFLKMFGKIVTFVLLKFLLILFNVIIGNIRTVSTRGWFAGRQTQSLICCFVHFVVQRWALDVSFFLLKSRLSHKKTVKIHRLKMYCQREYN